MSYVWKITDISAENEIITHAKYHVIASDEQNSVETEGNWYFDCPEGKIAFKDVTEELIAHWIQSEAVIDGKCHITAQLDKQLEALRSKNKAILPWLPQVFTPNI